MGEVQNKEWLEVILLTRGKVITNKVIMLDLEINSVFFNIIVFCPTNH